MFDLNRETAENKPEFPIPQARDFFTSVSDIDSSPWLILPQFSVLHQQRPFAIRSLVGHISPDKLILRQAYISPRLHVLLSIAPAASSTSQEPLVDLSLLFQPIARRLNPRCVV